MGEKEDYDKGATPTAHASTHENGGSDEISVTGLSGLLADGQTPLAHKTSHQDTGTDEISVEGLSGTLADDQHIIDSEAVSAMGVKGNSNPLNHDRYTDSEALAAAVQAGAITDGVTKAPTHDAVYDVAALLLDHSTRHENDGLDEISVEGLSGQLADPQTSLFQKARAYCGSAQSIQDNATTKINIDTASFDPGAILDVSNNRIKPTLAGYYQANGNVSFGPGCTAIQTFIYKNGNVSSRTYLMYVAGNNFGGMVSDLIYCNGSTDYLELWVYQLSGVTRDLDISSVVNYLSVVGPF
jgi:hypothetical protein